VNDTGSWEPLVFDIIHVTFCIIDLSELTTIYSWSWSYGSCIYNYLCNRCLSPLKLWVWIPLMVRCTRYNIMWLSLSVTCDRSVVFSRYSGFLHQ
jgi:hypothetical protein